MSGCSNSGRDDLTTTQEAPLPSAAVESSAQPVVPNPPISSAKPEDPSLRERAWEAIFAHVATHCYVDELAPTNYAVQWLNHLLPREQAPAGAPWPSLKNQAFPAPNTPEARVRADELRKKWLDTPQSHVVDCYFAVPQRSDPAQVPTTKEAHYAAYLPAALFVTPERVRVALVYSPGGGRGGHSRPFLTEIPGKTIHDIAAGGLGTKYRLDQWLSKHPDASPPIFFALHSNGEEYGNSATEFLTDDVAKHIGAALLGGVEAKEIVLGIEGVSSGARTIMLALRARPHAFATVGLSCMACGGVDIRRNRIGSPEEVRAWAAQLSERAKRGELRMRFAIGSRDNQLPCNKELHRVLGEAGMFDRSRAAEFYECKEGVSPSESTCDYEVDGFRVYRGELHDYHFLSRSWQHQLEFHLEALSDRHLRGMRGPGHAP
ncbi:MAG TPA: hypothetical protein PK156_39245 [Polyangium sp.]|nr:hypothetical protein [Polyangium sp.]